MYRASSELRDTLSETTWLVSARQFLIRDDGRVTAEFGHSDESRDIALEVDTTASADV